MSFFVPFIQNYFNIFISNDAEPIINYALDIFIVSLVNLLCLIYYLLYFRSSLG